MSKKAKTAITPTRAQDYPECQQVIRAADLAESHLYEAASHQALGLRLVGKHPERTGC